MVPSDKIDRLCEVFTAREILGMLDAETVGRIYDTVARLGVFDNSDESDNNG